MCFKISVSVVASIPRLCASCCACWRSLYRPAGAVNGCIVPLLHFQYEPQFTPSCNKHDICCHCVSVLCECVVMMMLCPKITKSVIVPCELSYFDKSKQKYHWYIWYHWDGWLGTSYQISIVVIIFCTCILVNIIVENLFIKCYLVNWTFVPFNVIFRTPI